jgi:hypothetical protein
VSGILLADGARLQSIEALQVSTLTYEAFRGQLSAPQRATATTGQRLGAIFA